MMGNRPLLLDRGTGYIATKANIMPTTNGTSGCYNIYEWVCRKYTIEFSNKN